MSTGNQVARLTIGRPRRLTTVPVLILHAYGLLLFVPVLAAILVASSLGTLSLVALVAVAAFAVATFFLPIGFGNPYVKRLVREYLPPQAEESDRFVVQVTLNPRLHSGLRGLVEDADDFGYLWFTESELVFRGDALYATIPFTQIREVQRLGIRLRGLFLCKRRIAVVVPGLEQVESLEFAERSSSVLPGSRAAARKLYERLCAAAGKPG